MTSYLTLIKTIRLSCTVFELQCILRWKWPILTHPTCICCPRRGWSRLNFAMIFGIRKLRVMGLACGVICVILCLSVLIQYTDTHRQTDKQIHYNGIQGAPIKNNPLDKIYYFSYCNRFLPRDSYAKRGICRRHVSVCLCVCLSVTLRYCIKTAKCRITQTTPHDSPVTLVIWCQRSWRNSNGITPYGGDKCRWGRLKLVTFDEKRALTRKRYNIDA